MNQLRAGRRRLRLAAFALAIALAACGDEGRLENELSDRYGMAIVGVPDSVTGKMVVVFPSSPFAERSDAERRGTARKVAEYVRDHYPRYKTVNKVTVEFLTNKESVADTLKHAPASYTFTRAELASPGP